MSQPFDWLNAELRKLEQSGLLRTRAEVVPLPEGRCRVDGRELWNFAANDYLGLAGDSRLAQAAAEAIRECGVGARAASLVTGRTHWHARLEERLADFKQAEAAVLFPTGYAANVSTIAALVDSQDVIYCDRLNHASLIDGCRLSRAKFRVYPHCDMEFLRKELEKGSEFRRRLIVTDSLFSMDGDIAPLAQLCALAEEFDALLLVDEAHATGVFGEKGTGCVEAARSTDTDGPGWDRVIPVGTLSKACGSQGGFVTGPQELCDWLWNSARMQVFSTALAIPACAAALAAIDIIQRESQRRAWLAKASLHVRETIRGSGWNVPASSVGPIVPILLGEAAHTMSLADELRRRGILAAAIRPPTVPDGTARLRVSLSFAHGDAGIAALLAAFAGLSAPPRASGCSAG